MKCSLGISDFLEEISSLSHSVVFLYFFALIAEEGFLISPCYSLELCIQMFITFLFKGAPMLGRRSRPEGASPDVKWKLSQLFVCSGAWTGGQWGGVLAIFQLSEHPRPKGADAFPSDLPSPRCCALA